MHTNGYTHFIGSVHCYRHGDPPGDAERTKEDAGLKTAETTKHRTSGESTFRRTRLITGVVVSFLSRLRLHRTLIELIATVKRYQIELNGLSWSMIPPLCGLVVILTFDLILIRIPKPSIINPNAKNAFWQMSSVFLTFKLTTFKT